MGMYSAEELAIIRQPKVEMECYVSGHMGGLVIHSQKPDRYSFWPNSMMGGSIIGESLYDRLLQKTSKRVKITIEEIP